MTVFYLIRHGETDWNIQGIWQGHADTPLNDTGRAQAQRLAARLKREAAPIDMIFSSDLHRAYDTALAAGTALGVKVHPLPALREIDLGRWSGLTREQVMALDGPVFERIAAGEDLPRGGAESMADVGRRVAAAVEELARQYPDQTIGLVSHGGSIRSLIAYAAGDRPVQHGHIGNTSLSILQRDVDGWQIIRLNDMAHLADAPQEADLLHEQPPGDEEVAAASEE